MWLFWWKSMYGSVFFSVLVNISSVLIHVQNTAYLSQMSYAHPTLPIYIYIYIYIILSCHRHRYPWPFLPTSPYRSSLPTGPQGYTPYFHRAAVCRFELVALHLPGLVKGPIVVHHLWPCPYFSSSVLHVWFV